VEHVNPHHIIAKAKRSEQFGQPGSNSTLIGLLHGQDTLALKNIIGCQTAKNAQSNSGTRGSNVLNNSGVIPSNTGRGLNLKIKVKNDASLKNLSTAKKASDKKAPKVGRSTTKEEKLNRSNLSGPR
jgi:hypothetical protein